MEKKMKNNIIYLDNNATTKIDEEVFEAMKPFLTLKYGNPSSMHKFGGQVRHDIDKAREQAASLIGASPEEIIFTGCGTESDNSAIISALQVDKKKRHIVTTVVEHEAVLLLCKKLEEQGYEVTYLNLDNTGQISLKELQEAVRDDTAVVSMMYANNETGIVFPIEKAGEIIKQKGTAIFHCDAVQAVGKLPIDLSNSSIDMLSFSGHKLHAPKGVGGLYVSKGVRFYPYIIGGHQEKTRRAGTENTASIVGMGKAFEIAKQNIDLYTNGKIKQLRDKLENALLNNISDSVVNGKDTERTGNTLSISFKNIEGESILLLLDEQDICASSGSACTSDSLEPSHVIKAMGVSHLYAHGTVRFSLSKYTTDEEIDKVIECMPGIVSKLRDISPFK
jgi:cysteine desulfurase